MEFQLLDLSNPEMCKQWDAFAQWYECRGHHHHTEHLRAILQAYPQHQHLSLIAKRHHDVVGILPLIGMKSPLFGKVLVSLPYYNYGGGLAVGDEVEHAMYQKAQELAQRHGYSRLQIRADKPLPEAMAQKNWGCQSHKANMLLALPDDMHTLGHGNAKKRAKLRSQAGLAARKAEEQQVSLAMRFGGLELLNDFYQVFSENMRDLGTPVFGKDFFRSVFANIPSEIVVTYWDGVPVGCGWLFHHSPKRVSIPWASTLKRMNSFSINTYMYHQILMHCHAIQQRTGMPLIFDFGRSTIDAGTYHFKAQWGAVPAPCYWYEWRVDGEVASSPTSTPTGAMAILSQLWQRMPLPLTNFLGPHLIKNIPA